MEWHVLHVVHKTGDGVAFRKLRQAKGYLEEAGDDWRFGIRWNEALVGVWPQAEQFKADMDAVRGSVSVYSSCYVE